MPETINDLKTMNDVVEFRIEDKWDLKYYIWTWKYRGATVLEKKWCDFLTVAFSMNKEWWVIEQVSHMAKNLTDAKKIIRKMYDIALWYKTVIPWKE